MTGVRKSTRLNSSHTIISYDWSSDVCSSRSEEHTSELQSHDKLVCRLLVEKKKEKSYKGVVINTGVSQKRGEAKVKNARTLPDLIEGQDLFFLKLGRQKRIKDFPYRRFFR